MSPLQTIEGNEGWFAVFVATALTIWRLFWKNRQFAREDHVVSEVAVGYANLLDRMQKQLDDNTTEISTLRGRLDIAAGERSRLIVQNISLKRRVAELEDEVAALMSRLGMPPPPDHKPPT